MPYTYFVVVGKNDAAIFEYPPPPKQLPNKEMHLQLRQFILHAALDSVDEAMWTTGNYFLSKVDKYEEYWVSAYVSHGSLRLLIMQDSEPYDIVKHFFAEAHELCVKYWANPFTDAAAPVTSKAFAQRMETIYHRYFM